MFRKNLSSRVSPLKSLIYVNIQICSKDLKCIVAFLNAMPRVATVVSIYVLRLQLLHLNGRTFSVANDSDLD